MQRSLLSSTPDLSLPDVTVRVAASRIAAYCLKLQLSASFFSFLLSSFLSLLPLPASLFLLSLSLFFFFLPSPFPAVFGARSKSGASSPPIVSVLRGARRSDPSLLLSLSPLSPLSLFLSRPLSLSPSLSSPCCDRAHLLDLGYTRSESNYPIGPRSHFTVSSPHSTGFWESSSSRPLLLSLPRFY